MKGRTVFPTKMQPLDRTALVLIVVLSILIGLLLLSGSRTAPRVRDFTWQGKQVGAEDTAFILTFSRPMDQSSVEDNLRIVPPLPGKFSWAGRRMAYTLETPAPYGETFRLELRGARDRFTPPDNERNQMPLYVGEFRTRDRAFVYLGVKGEQEGRLVLQNLTTQVEEILTPPELAVMDFEPYPEGDRILFSASDRASQEQGLLDQKLYTVTTGIQIQAPAGDPGQRSSGVFAARSPELQPPGRIEQILDSDAYQNLKFDLAPDGETIIVQRVNRQDPGDFGLWMVKPDIPPEPIETEPGGDFLITPDSNAIAMTQGQGLAILPIESNADPLDFLPQYGQILSFAKDGSAAAVVQFNVDDPNNPTRSLFIVTNQGTETELLRTDGNVVYAQFDPTNELLYSLYTKRIPGDVYAEEPYLAAIPLPRNQATSGTTAETTIQKVDLLQLPVQRDLQMSLSPDGLGMLFDQIISTTDGADTGVVRSNEGRTIADSRLWFLPLKINENGQPIPTQPQSLPLDGLRPRWLP